MFENNTPNGLISSGCLTNRKYKKIRESLFTLSLSAFNLTEFFFFALKLAKFNFKYLRISQNNEMRHFCVTFSNIATFLFLHYLFVSLQYQVMPHFYSIVSLQTIIRYVIWNEIEQSLFVQIIAIFNVVLLRSNHGQILFFFATIFAKFHTTYILLVDQVGGYRILCWIMPRAIKSKNVKM